MEAWLQISEEFGLHGLSQNWGAMTLSAVISGQVFNILYGEHLTFSSVFFFTFLFFFPWQCNKCKPCYAKKKRISGAGYLHSIIRQKQNYDERKKRPLQQECISAYLKWQSFSSSRTRHVIPSSTQFCG